MPPDPRRIWAATFQKPRGGPASYCIFLIEAAEPRADAKAVEARWGCALVVGLVRKRRSFARGSTDTHIPIVVHAGGYATMVEDMEKGPT